MLEPLQNRFALLRIEHALAEVFRPPPRLKPSEWAAEHRQLSREANARGGRWRAWPFQIEPMDSVVDPLVQSTALQWASQLTGKTELVLNIIGYFIHQDPAPILVVQPNVTPMGEAFSKDRITTMVRDTQVLRGLIKESRTRDSGNTILHKSFPGGHLTIVGSNAPAGLASRPVRVAIFEEVDRFDVSAGKEGDPIDLGEKRTESFWNAVKFKNSTPTVKGRSRIETEIEQTDKRKWHVPCPHRGCKKLQVLAWHQVKWPEDNPEAAYLECQHCAKKITDKQREKMVRVGEWRPTAPFKGKRGYLLNGINVLLRAQRGFKNRLHQMATEFLNAKARGPESLKVWTNTFLAETWEDEAQEGPKPELIFARREDYVDLPAGCLVLTAGADVQADRIECEIVGFGEGEESWGIDYRVFKGNVESVGLWNELDLFIQAKYRHACGAFLTPIVTCIDSGHKSKIVYSFVRRCQPRRVFAVKGVGTHGVPWVTRSRKQPVLLLKVSTAKEAIYSRANLELSDTSSVAAAVSPANPGYCHWNKRYDLEYFRQLFSERVVTRFRFGQPVKIFEAHGRNEALDARVYAMAALDLLRPDYKILAAQLKAAADLENDSSPSETPSSTPQAPSSNRGGLGRTGWKI